MSKLRVATFGILALSVATLVPVYGTDGSGPSFRPTTTFKGSTLAGWRQLGDATWTVANGEITGTPKSAAGGWLVLDQSFQDVGVFSEFKCAAGCTTGILVRAEKTPDGGMKGVLLSLDPAPARPYAVVIDRQGKEVSREPLRTAGGQVRIAPPPPDANAPGRGGRAGRNGGRGAAAPAAPAAGAAAQAGGRAGAGRAGAPAGFTGGRGQAPPEVAAIQQQVVIPSAYKPAEWNQVEILADANIVRLIVNNAGSSGGVAEDEVGRYGPVALYVGGTGPASFKGVAYRDLMIATREPERVGAGFKAQQLSDFYYSWGISAADFNHDNVLDVLSGPHIFYGPDYTKRREIYVQQTINPSTAYSSDVWMQFSADFTKDGWADALNCNFGGGASGCFLYVNPGTESRRWDKFKVTPSQTTEIAVLADVNGDGQQDIVYGGGGTMQWATPNPAKPTEMWTTHVVSEPGSTIAHGVGAGDVNSDGRIDILNAYGWWEQPAPGGAADALWKYHPEPFSRSVGTRASNGGSVMAVYDVNGDRLNDVVTSLSAHGYGLAWFEQKKAANGDITFVRHMIMDDFTTKNAGDVTFTEPHGSTYADVDGDGIMDFIVGKRYWSHLDDWTDPDAYGPPVLYVYRTVRDRAAEGGARFVPELVHNKSGVGSHVFAGDLNKDGRTDILTATKFGTYIFWGQARPAAARR
jgi:hypothetical protein